MSSGTRPAPRSLIATVGSISFATSLSRILGLLRDQVQAYYFGAGAVSDAYLAAFRVPNLLRDLFAEGALSAAFVPTFVRARLDGDAASAWRLANRVFGALLVILGLLTTLILVFAPQILGVYVSGFDDAKMDLAVRMTRIVSPFLLFVAFAAVAMGMLNSCGRFFLPALAPVAFNVAAILGVLTLVPMFRVLGVEPGLALAWGAIAGGFLQFAVQMPALRREGFVLRPEVALGDPGLRRIGTLMLPATFGLAATQLNILVDTHLAASLGDGAISFLTYAFRLIQLPIGLFGVAIATANLARVSQHAARGDLYAIRTNLAAALRVAAVLTLPATAGLLALREPIVRVLFEWGGEFDARDTTMTAGAVLCYALGLFAYAVTKIQVPTFYALGDTRRPVAASAVAVAVKIAASLILLRVLPRFGAAAFLGLALSTSLASWVNFAQLAWAIRRRLGPFTGLGVWTTGLKMAAISALMAASCAGAHGWLDGRLGGPGKMGDVVRLAAVIGLGIAITVAGMAVLRIPEGSALLARWRARRGASR